MPRSRNNRKRKTRKPEPFKLSSRRTNEKDSQIFQYYSQAFQYFHLLIDQSLKTGSIVYRKEFWENVQPGIYSDDDAQNRLQHYKTFLEDKMRRIVEKYSIDYWLHVSRRIFPSTMGDDKRRETIEICRSIITAAVQKYALLENSQSIGWSDEVSIEQIFNGLFLKPSFDNIRKHFISAPRQLVLLNFDQSNLLEYYDLERIAFEMWYAGSKSRVIAKGAELVVDHTDPRILLDNRSPELLSLIDSFDSRDHRMTASATGAVFMSIEKDSHGAILIPEVCIRNPFGTYSDTITKLLGLKFYKGHSPNYHFVQINVRAFLHAHLEYSGDFFSKWGVHFEYVLACLTDVSLHYMESIVKKDVGAVTNIMSRAYQIRDKEELKSEIADNWQVVVKYLNINLIYDAVEIDKAIDFLSLNEVNRKEIYVDSFGPMKIFMPETEKSRMFIDLSVVGFIIYNIFYGIPLKDSHFKGKLLEDALKIEPSYLPVSESKGIDGTAKQVDFSVVRDDLLILVECKAVARSFGIFGGQASAIEHRSRNVINKGLGDVDAKIKWFLTHKTGTNYDISKLKFIVGMVVSPFTEFIYSKDKKYWLNKTLPRVINMQEFKILLESDVKQIIKYNIIPLESPLS